MVENKNRQIGFDFLRFLAIILVFCNHYLLFGVSSNVRNFGILLGLLGNGIFFFISGYLLFLNNNSFSSVGDILKFYKKRIKRIYPLYWIAIFLILISMQLQNNLNQISFGNLIASLLGLQMIFYPVYISSLILWFIGIIVIYYLIYPFIFLLKPKNSFDIIINSILIIIPLVLTKLFLGLIGGGVFEYYSIFILGIIAAKSNFLKSKYYQKYWISCLFGFIIVAFISLMNFQEIKNMDKYLNLSISSIFTIGEVFIIRFAIIILFILFIYNFFNIYAPFSRKFHQVITVGAISSYCLYLFHLLPSPIIKELFNPEFIPILYNVFIIFILLPLMVIICYYIQKKTDQLIK